MTILVTTPVTGGAQTGFTSPTYTVGTDQAPDVNAKQSFVSALGGTQAGVTTHAVASPFTLTFWRPKAAKVLPRLSPNGVLGTVPRNVYSVITRKGVTVLTGQPIETATIETKISIPAGSDVADIANLRAMFSLHIGGLNQQSANLGDTVQNGVL